MTERRVRITVGSVELFAALEDNETADKVWSVLPIDATATTWGDEIFFGIPVQAEEDDARDVVEMGDIAYWPPGQALCFFFGSTPASQGEEIRPASPVNVLGRMEGDPTVLRKVPSGAAVRVEKTG